MADIDLASMMAIAQMKGDARDALEKRNRKRRDKGKKPLPDEQEQKDLEVRRKRYRTADSTTVDGANALKLFEMRKAAMESDSDSDPDDPEDIVVSNDRALPPIIKSKKQTRAAKSRDDDAEAIEQAQKAAEAVRRVQDMKNGRIDHDGNWSTGQKLEGGDTTKLVDSGIDSGKSSDKDYESMVKAPKLPKNAAPGLNEFMTDLYERLRVSFGAIESTLSDLQGRVSEIVTASAKSPVADESGKDDFERLLSQKTPVVFDVAGTKMTFDAITVFHAPPCITIVSKSGSATIMPKPGAALNLTYRMDGKDYENDPVTFLGTRFELPMFGLSFVGFIRDEESSALDIAAGLTES